MPTEESRAASVGLPPRPFLYTLDQISMLISIPLEKLKLTMVYYENRSTGAKTSALLAARDIGPDDKTPEWRVSERELVRWMRYKGFKYYDRGYYV